MDLYGKAKLFGDVGGHVFLKRQLRMGMNVVAMP